MNKRILITGAAKRIGKEMALSFFNKGWDIVIHYNSSKEEALDVSFEIVGLLRPLWLRGGHRITIRSSENRADPFF